MGRGNGTLLHLEKQAKAEADAAAARTRNERFYSEVDRALAAGFTEREAPFAAIARLMRGPGTVGEIRRHLQRTRPEIYEEAS